MYGKDIIMLHYIMWCYIKTIQVGSIKFYYTILNAWQQFWQSTYFYFFFLQGESVTMTVSYLSDMGSNPVGCFLTPRGKCTTFKHALQVNRGENRHWDLFLHISFHLHDTCQSVYSPAGDNPHIKQCLDIKKNTSWLH